MAYSEDCGLRVSRTKSLRNHLLKWRAYSAHSWKQSPSWWGSQSWQELEAMAHTFSTVRAFSFLFSQDFSPWDGAPFRMGLPPNLENLPSTCSEVCLLHDSRSWKVNIECHNTSFYEITFKKTNSNNNKTPCNWVATQSLQQAPQKKELARWRKLTLGQAWLVLHLLIPTHHPSVCTMRIRWETPTSRLRILSLSLSLVCETFLYVWTHGHITPVKTRAFIGSAQSGLWQRLLPDSQADPQVGLLLSLVGLIFLPLSQ